jgi:phage terminase large subunit-like protein
MAKQEQNFNPREWETWDDKSKQKFYRALQAAGKVKKAWYCKKGRSCDGQPHDGYDYKHARGSQWPPVGHDWLTWLMRGGRGSGKTRTGSEWTSVCAMKMPYVSIIGPTWKHVRRYMIEGPSGLLKSFAARGVEVSWEPSNQLISLPCFCPKDEEQHDKHIIQVFTGEEPDRLRGPEHYAVWLDEPAHMPLIEAVWDMMLLGLRQGEHPHVLCTTTPLPTKWMKELIADPDTVSVTESTYANRENLSSASLKIYEKKYAGTRLGRQELYGEILEDVEGALWAYEWIENNRDKFDVTIDQMDRIVVGIDPAGTSSKQRDETGIIVVGKKGDHYYVFHDASGHFTPKGWGEQAWKVFDDYKADKVVAEKNYGGEMVLSTLTNVRETGPTKLVHSRRGKMLRAEPVAAMYEQGRVHHVGVLEDLESQLVSWVPDQGESPDRIDALVHAVTELSSGGGPASIATPGGRGETSPMAGLSAFQKTVSSIFGYRPREEISTNR